jgi:chlorobactene glucosyltransferase
VTWAIPAAYAAFFALLIYRYATRGPRLGTYAPCTAGPLVSVIVPARNEARNIAACLRSVCDTAYRPIEVIVVDDRSSDATAEIVERLASVAPAPIAPPVRLVRGTDPPPGWFGKQWAIAQGYRLARGELLLFTDADTRHHPELLPRAVGALEAERVDLVSVLPRQEMATFWERLVQPHVFVALAARVGDLRRVNRTRTDWQAIANGQFILTTRRAYEAAGTHEAVRGSVTDDLALAQTYVRRHLDIFLLHAEEYLATRMYRSLAEIVAGWTKNLAVGAPRMFPPLPGVRAAVPYVLWVPSLCWILPPLVAAGWGARWALATTAVSLAVWIAAYRFQGAPARYAVLYPIGAAMVAGIMIRSAWRGRTIEWRGRRYREAD